VDNAHLCAVGKRVERNVVTPITVLMAVYNPRLDQLERAVDSILLQTFRGFEFLIIDDGSTDPKLVRYLAEREASDSRIRVIREPHRGLTSSLNRGLQLASGELIARQDADDWSERNRLAKQFAYFEENLGTILCGTDAWTHQQNGRRLWRTHLPRSSADILKALQRGNPFVHGSTMFSKRAALELGGYRVELQCSQDYDFFWRMAERGTAANLAEPLYHYRYSGGSISAEKAAEQLLAHRASQKLARQRRQGHAADPCLALDEARRELTPEVRARQALLKQADHWMLAGEYRRAARTYVRLVSKHPANTLAWAKLARLGLFVTLPVWRHLCFR
jgi:glycosyltransferase involved in cell wall biosynthesis